MNTHRSGLLAAGNFIVDHVKIVDHYPAEDMLALIRSETIANGGGPYNVLKNLAAMGAAYPTVAAGLVGTDAHGSWILADCEAHGIQTHQLQRTDQAPTSYTDAMTAEKTGRRTFFHQPGANALLGPDHFDFTGSTARIFHLGYLMLLDGLDAFDGDRTGASRVLQRAREAGLETSVDIVSAEHPNFSRIARSAIPFTEHLIINEVEAGKIVGRRLDSSKPAEASAAAAELLECGVGKAVVIHFEEGVVVAERGGASHFAASLLLPPGFIKGATGAGDAFAAGYLHALHENMPMSDRIEMATCAAAACLTHPSPSGGLRPVADCLALGKSYPRRSSDSAKL